MATAQQPGPPAKRARAGPGPNAPPAGGDAEASKRGLISVNNLRYELPPDLSVVVSRTMHRHFFQSNEYGPNQRMVCQVNSGAGYVDPANSYLTFELETQVTSPDVLPGNEYNLTFGKGSAVNLFSNISIVARSGDEIERTEQLWSIMPEQDIMTRPAEWFQTVGELCGYADRSHDDLDAAKLPTYGEGNVVVNNRGAVAPFVNTGGNVAAGGVTTSTNMTRYVVPLACVSQFFRTTEKLIPAALASGLRFEFQLASLTHPFVFEGLGTDRNDKAGTAHAVTSWLIRNPRIVLDQYQLSDSIQRAMNETIASSGIEMPFIASHYSGYTVPANQQQANIEIRKAVSRALCVTHKVVDNSGLTSASIDANSTIQPVVGAANQGLGGGYTEYQVRVGSLYFPHQKMKEANPRDMLRTLYHHTLRGGASAFKRPQNPGSNTWNRFRHNSCVVWTDLERSSAQNLTGIPINNSRVIELSLQTSTTFALAQQQVQVFLHYVRLVRVFLNNVEVEE